MKKCLIVGLGNPGREYVHTRHNVGFDVVDELVRAHDGPEYALEKLAMVTKISIKSRPVTVIKPTTYMNLSGKAVKYYLEKEKINTENLLIVVDDVSLALATIRFRTKGTDGGHNGLKDIQNKINTTQYPRMRIGIGDDYPKGRQADYVLGRWSSQEMEALIAKTHDFVAGIETFVFRGITEAMNQYNG